MNNDSECDLCRMTEENILNGKLRPFLASLRKHPFLLALRCWGRFALRRATSDEQRARRNGCFRRLFFGANQAVAGLVLVL